MRKPSRFIAFLMAMVMIFTLLPAAAFAANDPFTLRISSETAAPGNEVQVKLSLENNPGIASMNVKVSFGSELTLTKVEFNSTELGGTATPPQKLTSPVTLSWVRPTQGNYYGNSLFATLTFTVNKNALGTGEKEKVVAITATYDQDNVYNELEQNIPMTVIDGQVKITNYLAGDINGDGAVNQKDLTRLFQFYADWDVWVNWPVMDVNGDGAYNQKDLTRLAQYFADWDVIINALPGYWPDDDCEHSSLTLMPAKAATCISEGNIAYYKCDDCGKLFKDAAASTPIALNETVTAKDPNNHPEDKIQIIPATETSTEGSKCDACGAVIIEPKPITPEPNTNSITYHIVDAAKHPYLGTVDIDTSALKYSYTPGQALTLANLDLGKYGYTFNGWYDGFGDNASQIKSIPANANEDYVVYAHVTEQVYNITYNVYQTPVTSKPSDEQKHYTVSKGNYNLWNPEINNYIFLGWYDKNGTEFKNISIGTTEDITLYPYYTSLRNYAVSKVDNNPLILEDQENDVVYFTYEIGEIKNIPLDTDEPFWEVQSVAGLNQKKTETKTTQISTTEAKSISDVITSMTVNSNTWTLAETWNEVTSVNEAWAESIGKTTEQCRTEATTSSNTLSISSQNGGSSYHKTEDGKTVYDYDSKTETNDKGHTFDASLSGKYANKMGANFGESNEYGTEASYSAQNAYTKEGKITADNWSASGSGSGSESGSASVSDKDKYSAGISYENGFEVNAGLSYGYHNNTNTVTKTGSDAVTVNSNIDENTSTWNESSTASATNTHSISETTRNTLSDIVTTTKEYGSSYSNGGTDSTTQGFSSTSGNSSGTTSTVTYSKLDSVTTTSEYSVDGKIEGKYRCILAGTAHVFGVVGYDYNTKSFFTYTFSVMDDKTEEFLDYTPKGGDFDDCENCCLPFEIPNDIFNYVSDRISKTTGIKYRTNSVNGTATITGYEGTDSDIVIPSYVSNGKQAYKVTEIASSAFAGKAVKSVVLGEFIKSIPEGAFKNCKELESVVGSFTEIGKEAFSGCAKLTNMNIPSNVVKIGEDAFKGVNSITVRAINSLSAYGEAAKLFSYPDNSTEEEIAAIDEQIEAKQKEITQDFISSVLNSGAQNISIDISHIVDGIQLTLEVPAINLIEINGDAKTYKNFTLKSDAKNTVINEMTIKNTSGIPLSVASDKLTLNQVVVNSNATGLILKNDGAVLLLEQDSTIQSSSKYTVVGKNPVIESRTSPDGSEGFVNIVGDFGHVNSIQGKDNINFINGDTKNISEEEFEKYVKGICTVTFNPNGGTMADADKSRSVVYGEKLGALPEPTKDYHDFVGWFDKAEGGNQYTSDTPVAGDITLYAHWKLKDTVEKLASDVPENADIISSRWTYTKTETAESRESSKDGWTPTGNRWEKTGSGSRNYASFPSGFDTGHWIYQSFASSPYTSSNNGDTKREVSNSWAGYVYWKWDYNAAYVNSTQRAICPYYNTYGTSGWAYVYFHAHTSTINHPYLDNSYCNNANMPSYNCSSEFHSTADCGPTPRFFRFDYYTSTYTDYQKIYQYMKVTDNLESTTPISNGGQISNVQEWVTYRPI